MKKSGLSILLIVIAFGVSAQTSIEFGINGGVSNYLGDLKPNSLQLDQNSLAMGLQSKLNLNSLLSARVSLSYGTIKGSDAKTDRSDLIARNLSFRSRITEFSVVGEFNLLHFGKHKLNKDNRKYHRFTPYAFGGLAIFNFKPETEYLGTWYELQPLGTEGQNVPNSGVETYKLTQISIPVGLGVKYEFTPNFIFGCELGWRKTFTDYLDDVSGNYYGKDDINQASTSIAGELAYRGDELKNNANYPRHGSVRGNAENKDWYILANLSITYKIFRTNKGKFDSDYF